MFEKLRVSLLQRAQRQEIKRYIKNREFSQSESKSLRHGRIGDWIDLGAGDKVLELGCGPGRYASMLKSIGFSVVAVDPHEFDDWSFLREVGGVEFRSGVFAEDLPFEDNQFDSVVCFGTLLYVNDVQKSLSEMKRVLKPGGRIALRTVNSGNNYTRRTGARIDPASNHLFTKDGLCEVLTSAGFRVNDCFGFGFFPPIAPAAYWFATAVLLPRYFIELIDRATPEERKHNWIIHAHLPSDLSP